MSMTATQTVTTPSSGVSQYEGHDGYSGHDTPVSLQYLNDTLPRSDTHVTPATVVHSRLQKIIVTMQLSGVNFASSAVNGLVVVGLPTITKDLGLPESLSFWPASAASLATASTLLLAGSVADAIGPRVVDLAGCFMTGAMMIGAGSSQKGTELVVFRALQGIGFAMHLAASVAIVTRTFPSGRGRNIAFSYLGLSQPLGFSFGLVLGGVLNDTVGWRVGWYLYGGLTLLLSTAGLWAIPKSAHHHTVKEIAHSFKHKIDWVGVILASTFMALLCYWFAQLSTDISKIGDAESVVLLCLSTITLPSFIYWVHRQVRRGKPALIPNSLWRNAAFSGICATIVISFAVLNSLELFASLFFQQVQGLSALQASVRILPSLVVGILLNFGVGLMIHRIPPVWIVIVSSVLCAGAPLLMAVIQPSSPYWANAFVAQLLQPVSTDAIFTVGLIVITEIFPEDTQALAGAVFNTAGQFGNAVGLAIMQVISTVVTQQEEKKHSPDAYMQGLRAGFWAMFGLMMLCGALGAAGLRKTGRVGLKRE